MTTTDNIDARITRLQGVVALLALVLAAILVWLAVTTPAHKILRTEALHLVTPDGDMVAQLETRDGYPLLVLKDENGTERVSLFHNAEGSGLYIADETATTRVGVAQFAHGGGGVALHGKDGKGALVLYFKSAGSLRFFGDDGEVIREISAADLRGSP